MHSSLRKIQTLALLKRNVVSSRRDRGGNLIQYMIHCKSRAKAKEQAKQASYNHKAPIENTAHESDQLSHFHPDGLDGEIKKNGQPFTYPKSK
ncbi:unnamed protein product [Rotaria socialis]|uniref:Uncharacterized protein n=1 Tax=Rotaria socialis TaxID=392032 RepID=A0A820WKV4_9BILA|nr:unnamed protein product [Rotaria socialis]CAF4518815.1 unnamed protein product [Rotaria socialis]